MPQRDGAGPQGKGPKTGRGVGMCASQNVQQQSGQKDAQQSAQTSSQQTGQRPMRRGCGCGRGKCNNS